MGWSSLSGADEGCLVLRGGFLAWKKAAFAALVCRFCSLFLFYQLEGFDYATLAWPLSCWIGWS
jgi:hypothetical protein